MHTTIIAIFKYCYNQYFIIVVRLLQLVANSNIIFFMTSQSILKILGTNIRFLRKDLGWTQETLAEKASISVPFMTQIELGRKSPSLEVISQIAIALGVDYAVLFIETDKQSKDRNSYMNIIKKSKNEILTEINTLISKKFDSLEEKLAELE